MSLLVQNTLVITPHGLAKVRDTTDATVTIDLGRSFAGSTRRRLRQGEAFALTRSCLVRILNVSYVGIVTNAVYGNGHDLAIAFRAPAPPDETRVLLTLRDDGWMYELNHPFGLAVEGPYILIRTALDRWMFWTRAIEETSIELALDQTIEDWIQRQRDGLAGTSGHLAYDLVLELGSGDGMRGRVVWHEFLCCATSTVARVSHPLGDFGPPLADYLIPRPLP